MIEVSIQMPNTRLTDRDKKLIHLSVANTIKSITEATFSSIPSPFTSRKPHHGMRCDSQLMCIPGYTYQTTRDIFRFNAISPIHARSRRL